MWSFLTLHSLIVNTVDIGSLRYSNWFFLHSHFVFLFRLVVFTIPLLNNYLTLVPENATKKFRFDSLLRTYRNLSQGELILDGQPAPKNLMDLVKDTLRENPNNSVIGFNDNSR